MRLFCDGTTGNYYLHLFYLTPHNNFRLLMGDREQLPPDTPPDVEPNTLGHMTMRVRGYHGWIDLKGAGKICGIIFSPKEELDPTFVETFSLDDATEILDDRRIITDVSDFRL